MLPSRSLELTPLVVEVRAILAQSVTAGARLTFPRRNVAPRRARIVVVIHAMIRGFLYFVN